MKNIVKHYKKFKRKCNKNKKMRKRKRKEKQYKLNHNYLDVEYIKQFNLNNYFIFHYVQKYSTPSAKLFH